MSFIQTIAICSAVIIGFILNAIIIGLIIKGAIKKAFKKKEHTPENKKKGKAGI